MRSISNGARCCNSGARVPATRSRRTPSRLSRSGQLAAASSAPITAGHSALSRARMPPPRRATIGAASREAARPIARNPGRRSRWGPAPDRVACWWSLGARLMSLIRSDASIVSRERSVGWPDPAALLAWYDRHRRALPWRSLPGEPTDPYRVWLSEIMLQQTTVVTVAPYFDRFVARWPDIRALAAASLDEVLHQWQGLGYYARARNLHACAGAVVERHGGRFPEHPEQLRALPGIGEYTAAAIAAIAFDHRSAAVDGNVERVVARLFAVDQPLPQAKPRLRSLATELVPERRAGDFAQALMDLGATLCTPRRPRCIL